MLWRRILTLGPQPRSVSESGEEREPMSKQYYMQDERGGLRSSQQP